MVRRASLTNDRAAGQSRKPETGEKNRQHKGDGHSKKPPSFHNAGVSIIHCLSLLLADFTAENGAPVRSFRLWDYGPRGRPTEVLTSKAEGRMRQRSPCQDIGGRPPKSHHRRSPGARCCPPSAAPVLASPAAARGDGKDSAAIAAKDQRFIRPPFARSGPGVTFISWLTPLFSAQRCLCRRKTDHHRQPGTAVLERDRCPMQVGDGPHQAEP